MSRSSLFLSMVICLYLSNYDNGGYDGYGNGGLVIINASPVTTNVQRGPNVNYSTQAPSVDLFQKGFLDGYNAVMAQRAAK